MLGITNLSATRFQLVVLAVGGAVEARERKAQRCEREWQAANDQYSGYTVYQGRTDRRDPVMMVAPEVALRSTTRSADSQCSA